MLDAIEVSSPLRVVIVHWNQPERCLQTVAAFGEQEVAVSIVVVDNGSTPEALEKLRANLTGADLVEAGHNLGFGAAANVGLRRWLGEADGSPWAAVAPHDALPRSGCLHRLVAAVERRPCVGLACADVGDGRRPVVDPYFGGITLPIDRVEDDGWVEAGYPHGTLLLAGRSCLQQIGLFDERYFAYCEEADLGQRARQAGWRVGLVKGAQVRNPHLSGGGAVLDYLMLRNTLLLVRDHFGRYKVSIRLAMALGQLLTGLVRPRRRPLVFEPKARLRAMADFLGGRFGAPPPDL